MSVRAPGEPPTIPGFSLVRLLGSGGFADVFLYEQHVLQRQVAVSSDGRPYIVMEFCSGALDERSARERLPVPEVLSIAVRIGSAIETGHRSGVLHRDITPSNILLTAYGHPVLSDFGIASSLGKSDQHDLVGMAIPWSAPEVLLDETSGTVRSEVWSLAATIFTLLATGLDDPITVHLASPSVRPVLRGSENGTLWWLASDAAASGAAASGAAAVDSPASTPQLASGSPRTPSTLRTDAQGVTWSLAAAFVLVGWFAVLSVGVPIATDLFEQSAGNCPAVDDIDPGLAHDPEQPDPSVDGIVASSGATECRGP